MGKTDVTSGLWYGHAPVPGYVMAWGARAVFRPGDFPLQFLPEWQAERAEGQDFAPMRSAIDALIPELQKLARQFPHGSIASFVRKFPAPDFPGHVLVAAGTPLGSCCFFYLSVSLVPEASAPPDAEPDIVRSKWNAKVIRRNRDEKGLRAVRRQCAITRPPTFTPPGVQLYPGDEILLSEEPAQVLAVLDGLALIECMRGERSQYREVMADTQVPVRTVYKKSKHKWKNLIR